MSLVYVFNVSEVMSKRGFYPILLPYFMANHLSWVYFKNKLPLYNKLDENIYFGRMPTKDEYEKLKDLGVEIFINLSSDLKFNAYYKANFTADLMDMTIQSPKKLDEIYKFILNHYDKKIFIHCKFGLSRTIIFLLYYMYKEKHIDTKEAFNQIKNISHIYKLKTYMQVNCQIFEKEGEKDV